MCLSKFVLFSVDIFVKGDIINVVSRCSSDGRVLGLGPRCRRFESCHLDQLSTEPIVC